MRKRIEKEKGSKNIWDLKNIPGGLLDIEFIAQWLAIKNGNDGATSTKIILEQEVHKELTTSVREKLLHAFELFNTILQLQRVCIGEGGDVKSASSGFVEIICSGMDVPDLKSAEAYLKAQQKDVRKIFLDLLK